MKKFGILLLMLLFSTAILYGQRRFDRSVSFSDTDGFSGWVKYSAQFENYLGAAALKYGRPEIIITDINYVTAQDKTVLAQHGINVTGNNSHTPERFAADVSVLITLGGRYLAGNISPGTTVRTDYTTFDIPEDLKIQAKSYRERTGKDYWEEETGFYPTGERVEKLYLIDLRNEIDEILREHRDQQKAFETAISRGTDAANTFNFDRANELLAEAQSVTDGSLEHNGKIRRLDDLIKAKTKEREKEELAEKEAKELAEKEKEEQLKKEAAELAEREKESAEMDEESPSESSGSTPVSSASGSSGPESADEDDEDDTSESSESSSPTIYRPKTNTEMYNELKAMVDQNPELLNDPSVRQRLRHLEVDSKREIETYRRHQSGIYAHGNYQALASMAATDRRVDTYTKAVGDITDNVTSIVNSIIADSEARAEQRRAEIQAGIDHFYAKREALKQFDGEQAEKRKAYSAQVLRGLEQAYDEVSEIYHEPVLYETEVEDNDSSDPHAFVRKKIPMGSFNFDSQFYRVYIVRDGDLYGVAGDDGSLIYPPQFEGIMHYHNQRGDEPRLLINIADKWGEIGLYGDIISEVKYDGIWYTQDGWMAKKLGNNWEAVSLSDKDGVESLLRFTQEEFSESILDGLLSVINLNDKGLGYTYGGLFLSPLENRYYSLPENAWKSEDFIVVDTYTMNDSHKLFKLKDKWYAFRHYEFSFKRMGSEFVVPVERDGYWGAINQDEEIIIPFEHQYLKDFENGRSSSDKGVFNDKGELLLSGDYDYVSAFDGGYALFRYKDEKEGEQVGLITESGEEIIRRNGNSWYQLGLTFSGKDTYANTLDLIRGTNEAKKNINLDLAVYCLTREPEESENFMWGQYHAGFIYYRAGSQFYPNALKHLFHSARQSDRWIYYTENMQRSYYTKSHRQYGKYFSEANQYSVLLFTIGDMYYHGDGTAPSLENARFYLDMAKAVAQLIIAEFEFDQPNNLREAPADLSSTYYTLAGVYERLGDLKSATKTYKLAKKRKDSTIVPLADKRLKAIKAGQAFRFEGE